MKRKIRRIDPDAAPAASPRDILRCGSLKVDTAARIAEVSGEALDLQPKVFDLLVILLREPGVVHTREALFQRLWPGTVVLDGNLTSALSQLRRAVDDETRARLRTVPRVGYAFDGEVVRDDEDAVETTAASIPATLAAPARVLRWRRPWLAGGMLLALLVALGVYAVLRPGAPTRPIVVLGSITAESEAADARWIGMAIRDAFLRRLGGDPALRVVDGAASAGPALLAQASQGDAAGADVELEVRYGRVAPGDEALTITVTLRDARRGGELATLRDVVPLRDVLDRADALARDAREHLLPDTPSPSLSKAAVSQAAVEAYTDGLRALDGMRLQEAQVALERAVALAPGFVQAELRLAEVLRRKGYHALAAGVYRRLAAEADDDSEARLLATARAHAFAGDNAAAGEAYARLVARFPDDPRHAIEWARVLAPGGAEGRAAAWRLLEANAPSASLPDWAVRRLLVVGLLQEHEGRHREAAATFSSAHDQAVAAGMATLAGDAALERGRMHQRLGEREPARASWQQARAAYADAGLPLDEAGAELNLLLSSRFDDPPTDPAAVRAGILALVAQAKDLGAIDLEAQAFALMAEDLANTDEPAAAAEASARAIARFTELGNRFDAARSSVTLARARLALGDATTALTTLDSINGSFAAGTPEWHDAARLRVQALIDRGATAAARKAADEAVASLASGENPELLALARCTQVNALRAVGADGLAAEALEDCMAWRNGAESPNLQLVAADLALGRGDGTALRQHLARAIAGLDAMAAPSLARNQLERGAASLLIRAGALAAARTRLARIDPALMATEPAPRRRDHALLEALLSAYLDNDLPEARRRLAQARDAVGPEQRDLMMDLVDVALADPVRDRERRDALLQSARATAASHGHAPTRRLADELSSLIASNPDARPGYRWLVQALPPEAEPAGRLRVTP